MSGPSETSFPFKAVLFDWANTLVDLGSEDAVFAFRELMNILDERGKLDEKFETIYQDYRNLFYGMIEVSKGSHREANFEFVLKYILIKYGISIGGQKEIESLLKFYYRSLYKARKVFLDVFPTLKVLKSKGVRLGIISNTTNPEFMKDWERRYFGLDPYFEFSIYSSSVPYRKPHPSIFELAICRLGMKPKEIMFVGDDPKIDILGAQGVGMVSVWLNRDNIASVANIQPDYQIKSLLELIKLASVPD